MTIETRHTQRIVLHLEAQMLYRGRCFQVEVKNLSTDGISLKTGTFTVPNGTLIDLEFCLGEARWQVSGLVVHQSAEGIGVMFRVSQPELFQLASELWQMTAVPLTPPDYEGGLWQEE